MSACLVEEGIMACFIKCCGLGKCLPKPRVFVLTELVKDDGRFERCSLVGGLPAIGDMPLNRTLGIQLLLFPLPIPGHEMPHTGAMTCCLALHAKAVE